MGLRVWRASAQERAALFKTYAAYMAEIVPQENPAESASYFESYWQEPGRHIPYLFGAQDAQGFAFVQALEDPELDFEMAEFCVYPAFRGQGLGTAALRLILADHSGRWEASVLHTNAMGKGFWPEALSRAGVVELRYRDDDVARDYRFSVA